MSSSGGPGRGFDPASLPVPPPINRRSTTPLPGLSSTASSLRARRSRIGSSSLRREAGISHDALESEELLSPDAVGDVAGHPRGTNHAYAYDGPASLSQARARPAATLVAPSKKYTRPAVVDPEGKSTTTGGLPVKLGSSGLGLASATPGRPAARPIAAITSAFEPHRPAGSGHKGTPARSVRYSLPVRGDKPVRSTKTSGKHVVLPSESQLAPLPSEEGAEDEDDEDEDEEESSSEEQASGDVVTKATQDGVSLKGRNDGAELGKLADSREESSGPFRGPAREKRLAGDEQAHLNLEKKHAKPEHAPPASGQRRKGVLPDETQDDYHAPLRSRAPPKKPRISGPPFQTFERMTPARRAYTSLPRLSSFAIGPSIHLPSLVGFLRREHGVRPRLYDECAYVVYFKPLLPGFGKAEVRSAPEPRSGSPGAESRRERELLDREESGYTGSYFAQSKADQEDLDADGFIRDGNPEIESRRASEDANITHADSRANSTLQGLQNAETEPLAVSDSGTDLSALEEGDDEIATPKALVPTRVASSSDSELEQMVLEHGTEDSEGVHSKPFVGESDSGRQTTATTATSPAETGEGQTSRAQRQRRRKRKQPTLSSHHHDTSANVLTSRAIREALQVAELVVLPYGVLVMYNFSATEERSVINDILSSGCIRGGAPLAPEDEEAEAFHFCYDPSVPAPRIFNDFFTFRTPNHLLKLSLAHAIAQSTKLSVFEESMQKTLELTSHIPKELASTGELKLKRREALRLTGKLFKLRVDVNLTSNVLDTPELFWSESTLKALYDAIREYLEIDQRVENLNERLAVANDLLDVIHSHISNAAMHTITWVIILLIVVACIVACGEVSARLILHARQASRDQLSMQGFVKALPLSVMS